MEKKKTRRGGARPNSGRPRKDPTVWGHVTCVLRRDTIERLKAGCGGASKHFGAFLQDHLDAYPLPSRETYLTMQKLKAQKAAGIYTNSAWDKRVRLLRRQEREEQREQRRLAKMTPKERKAHKEFLKDLDRIAKKFPGPEKAKAA